jgi:hypothetical protein
METIYLASALVGGTLLVCQVVFALFGFGDHHDVDGHDLGGHDFHPGGADHDHGAAWFVGVLTFRTLVAALTFFGLAGMAATSRELGAPHALAVAVAAGAAALFLVAFLMRGLYGLRAEGTARIERAVGKSGTVYLTVPGRKAGVGKVTLSLQNRTVEYQAVTAQDDLPTGAKVFVLAVVAPDTVEVAPVPEPERTARA